MTAKKLRKTTSNPGSTRRPPTTADSSECAGYQPKDSEGERTTAVLKTAPVTGPEAAPLCLHAGLSQTLLRALLSKTANRLRILTLFEHGGDTRLLQPQGGDIGGIGAMQVDPLGDGWG